MNRLLVSVGALLAISSAVSTGFAQSPASAPAPTTQIPGATQGSAGALPASAADSWATASAPEPRPAVVTPGAVSAASPSPPMQGSPKVAQGSPASPAAPAAVPPRKHRVSSWKNVDAGQLGFHQRHWVAQLGWRNTWVQHPGIDLFDKNNAVGQITLGVGGTFWSEGRRSLAVLAGYDYGGVKSSIRGAQTSLSYHRIWVAPELRYHLLPALYAYGRTGIGAVSSLAKLNDEGLGAEFKAAGWGASFDAALGIAAQVFGKGDGAAREARLWAAADAGYGWTTSTSLRMNPDSGPARTEPLDLGSMVLRGPQIRILVFVTY